MKKKTILPLACALFAILLQACSSHPDPNLIRKQVLTYHDTLMSQDEKAMMLKMRLENLVSEEAENNKSSAYASAKENELKSLIYNLDKVDEQMTDWMHVFNGDFKGKSTQEATDYFIKEKKKVLAIDSNYKSAITNSSLFLNQNMDSISQNAD